LRLCLVDEFNDVALRTDANDLQVVEDHGKNTRGGNDDSARGASVFHPRSMSLLLIPEYRVFSLTRQGAIDRSRAPQAHFPPLIALPGDLIQE
jgi:hypothetical protein